MHPSSHFRRDERPGVPGLELAVFREKRSGCHSRSPYDAEESSAGGHSIPAGPSVLRIMWATIADGSRR
jgi:hypothetical protein